MNPKFERAIGKLLRGVRAEKYLALNDPRFTMTPVSISLTSSAFVEGGAMPKRYAGQGVGENLSPPLGWADLPAATRELVLIMQDPDAPLPSPRDACRRDRYSGRLDRTGPMGALAATAGGAACLCAGQLRPHRLCGAAAGTRPRRAPLCVPAFCFEPQPRAAAAAEA
ncbi:MAG: hypothetical protein WDN29_11290 [Methylovirgula sp.]